MTSTRRKNYSRGASAGGPVAPSQQPQPSEQRLEQVEDELQKLRQLVEKQNLLLERLSELGSVKEKEKEKSMEVDRQPSKMGEKLADPVQEDNRKAKQSPDVQNVEEGVAENAIKPSTNAPIGGCHHPFTENIMKVRMPRDFKIVAAIEPYDGSTDPLEHIDEFQTAMTFQGEEEAVVCRAFPLTLKKAARQWFASLPLNSINNWNSLFEKFKLHFTSSKQQPKSSHCLEMVKQKRDEPLWDFITRFTQEALSIKNLDPAITLHVLVGNLKPGRFAESLAMDPPKTMEDLRARSEKWIRLEDYHKTLVVVKSQEVRGVGSQQNQYPKRGNDRHNDRDNKIPRGIYNSYTPLVATPAKIYRDVMTTEIRDRPPPLRSKVKNMSKYCSYHKDHGHNTNECIHLKDAIEKLIRQGRLREYVQSAKEDFKKRRRSPSPSKQDRRRTQYTSPSRLSPAPRYGGESDRRPRSPERKTNVPRYEGNTRGVIHAIAGGFSVMSTELQKRKRGAEGSGEFSTILKIYKKASPLQFSDEDFLDGPTRNNEPLVVSAILADFEVRRVFVDQGSSADILFWDCFQKLGLNEKDLVPHQGRLIGFTGDTISPKGYIELRITLGRNVNSRSVNVKFLVVDCPSAYNIILGRPSLNKLGAVVSTLHLAMKFYTEDGKTITVWGNGNEARNCYIESLKITKRTPEAFPNQAAKPVMMLNLDPRADFEHQRPQPEGDQLSVQIGKERGHTVNIGSQLPEAMKEEITELLRRNSDLFAWTSADMPGVDPDFCCHRLSLCSGYKPVAQKKGL